MTKRRIEQLSEATEIPTDDQVELVFEDKLRHEFRRATLGDIQRKTLLDFYWRVCERAESNMAATNTVSGAHWNAMRQELSSLGIEV